MSLTDAEQLLLKQIHEKLHAPVVPENWWWKTANSSIGTALLAAFMGLLGAALANWWNEDSFRKAAELRGMEQDREFMADALPTVVKEATGERRVRLYDVLSEFKGKVEKNYRDVSPRNTNVQLFATQLLIDLLKEGAAADSRQMNAAQKQMSSAAAASQTIAQQSGSATEPAQFSASKDELARILDATVSKVQASPLATEPEVKNSLRDFEDTKAQIARASTSADLAAAASKMSQQTAGLLTSPTVVQVAQVTQTTEDHTRGEVRAVLLIHADIPQFSLAESWATSIAHDPAFKNELAATRALTYDTIGLKPRTSASEVRYEDNKDRALAQRILEALRPLQTGTGFRSSLSQVIPRQRSSNGRNIEVWIKSNTALKAYPIPALSASTTP